MCLILIVALLSILLHQPTSCYSPVEIVKITSTGDSSNDILPYAVVRNLQQMLYPPRKVFRPPAGLAHQGYHHHQFIPIGNQQSHYYAPPHPYSWPPAPSNVHLLRIYDSDGQHLVNFRVNTANDGVASYRRPKMQLIEQRVAGFGARRRLIQHYWLQL